MAETARLDSLKLWDRNYRRGDVQAIKRSIVRFGFNGALRIRAGVVMAGNHSLLALRELEAEKAKPPTNIIVEKGRWFVPVIALDHLSDDEATAFAIADNRTSDLGEYDDESLRLLTDELLRVDPSLVADAGFELSIDFGELAEKVSEEAKRLKERAEQETEEASDITLRWQTWNVFLSAEEAEGLSLRAKEYLARNGSTYGFVKSLLRLD